MRLIEFYESKFAPKIYNKNFQLYRKGFKESHEKCASFDISVIDNFYNSFSISLHETKKHKHFWAWFVYNCWNEIYARYMNTLVTDCSYLTNSEAANFVDNRHYFDTEKKIFKFIADTIDSKKELNFEGPLLKELKNIVNIKSFEKKLR